MPGLADDAVNGKGEVEGRPFDGVGVRLGEGGGVEVVGCVVGVEEGLAVVEVVCLCLVFVGAEEFLFGQKGLLASRLEILKGGTGSREKEREKLRLFERKGGNKEEEEEQMLM